MSDAVSETSQQHGRQAAASEAGHGRHRGAASSAEEPRTQAAGPGRHRRPRGDRSEDDAAA